MVRSDKISKIPLFFLFLFIYFLFSIFIFSFATLSARLWLQRPHASALSARSHGRMRVREHLHPLDARTRSALGETATRLLAAHLCWLAMRAPLLAALRHPRARASPRPAHPRLGETRPRCPGATPPQVCVRPGAAWTDGAWRRCSGTQVRRGVFSPVPTKTEDGAG
jgi:hypothetical protein